MKENCLKWEDRIILWNDIPFSAWIYQLFLIPIFFNHSEEENKEWIQPLKNMNPYFFVGDKSQYRLFSKNIIGEPSSWYDKQKALAEYPSPSLFIQAVSSHDRTPVDPDQKSGFANWDRSMFVRTETGHGRKEYVLMNTNYVFHFKI